MKTLDNLNLFGTGYTSRLAEFAELSKWIEAAIESKKVPAIERREAIEENVFAFRFAGDKYAVKMSLDISSGVCNIVCSRVNYLDPTKVDDQISSSEMLSLHTKVKSRCQTRFTDDENRTDSNYGFFACLELLTPTQPG